MDINANNETASLAASSGHPARAIKKRKLESVETVQIAKRMRKYKAGRLALLLSIPMDVIFEIFGHLHPHDLLRLARTSRELRGILMHRSSVTVWRAAISNVPGLPGPRPGMNEPQWTDFVFNTTCQVCSKVARKIDWALFVRICSKCAGPTQALGMRVSGLGCFPKTDVLLQDVAPSRRDYTRHANLVFFRPYIMDIVTRYLALETEEAKEAFISEQTQLVKDLKQHSILCEAWSRGIADNRSQELTARKDHRYNAIVDRLTALGWGFEITSLESRDDLRTHKLVKGTNPLTDRGWLSIKVELVQYMEAMKTKRIAKERAALILVRKGVANNVLRNYKRSQLPWTEVMPSAGDFHRLTQIEDILNHPTEIGVDEKSFDVLLPEFPAMFATWRERLETEMVALFRKRNRTDSSSKSDQEVSDTLRLATTVFHCNSCGSGSALPLFWPRVLGHRCLTGSSLSSMPYFLSLLSNGLSDDRTLWHTSSLMMHKRAPSVIRLLVALCGKDPDVTTVEEMDASSARFACHHCALRKVADVDPSAEAGPSSRPGQKQIVLGPSAQTVAPSSHSIAEVRAFDWRNALKHDLKEHSAFEGAWYRLDDADSAVARSLEVEVTELAVITIDGTDPSETESIATVSQLPRSLWCCAHCIDVNGIPESRTMEETELTYHLTQEHDITHDLVLNEDYYCNLACPEVPGIDNQRPRLRITMPPGPPTRALQSWERCDIDPGLFWPSFLDTFYSDDEAEMMRDIYGSDWDEDEDDFYF
ncbi:unnamed protein product [Mycena citricolor]|uniref:F-box domain-containing protein n=1 Tax=Mycena citricolor TaxID=2018698 RepID=A0AAD2GVY4_9AGAR|nr:unnamed protein product [Mycena citricolor]